AVGNILVPNRRPRLAGGTASDRIKNLQRTGDLPQPGRQVAADLIAGRKLQYVVGKPLRLRGRDARQQVLDRGDEGRAHAEPAQSHTEEHQGRARLTGHLSAQGHGGSCSRARVKHHLQNPENRWAQRLAKVRNLWIVSIRGHEILDQVVRADRDEVGLAQQGVDAEGGGGNLDHHARLDILGKEYTFPPKVVARLLHHLVDLAQLFQGR